MRIDPGTAAQQRCWESSGERSLSRLPPKPQEKCSERKQEQDDHKRATRWEQAAQYDSAEKTGEKHQNEFDGIRHIVEIERISPVRHTMPSFHALARTRMKI